VDSITLSSPRCLVDSYGRYVSNLRISLTQRCNFDCFFCHKEGQIVKGGELTPSQIEVIAKAAYELGMTKIKLTGGEPLLRSDIIDIVSRIARHTSELSLTTNGYLLKKLAFPLKTAGLHRVNVSLHSIHPATFTRITGINGVAQVKEGVTAAIDAQLHPVKINMVVLKGINDTEISQMIDYSAQQGAILQLIEFQPVQNENWTPWRKYHLDIKDIEGNLANKALRTIERDLHRRKQYTLPRANGIATIEVVRPMHNSKFCQNCHRLRITSDGKIKPCLLRNDNLIPLIRNNIKLLNLQNLKQAFQFAVNQREPYWRQ
jgi:cyclic pyranopterin phosphate synthase